MRSTSHETPDGRGPHTAGPAACGPLRMTYCTAGDKKKKATRVFSRCSRFQAHASECPPPASGASSSTPHPLIKTVCQSASRQIFLSEAGGLSCVESAWCIKHKTTQVSRCYYLQLWVSKQHFSSLNYSVLPEKGFFMLLSDPDSAEPEFGEEEPPAAAVASNNLCCEQGPADWSL